MAQTRIPTGEKAPLKFRAPQFVPTDRAQTQRFVQSQLQAIAADLQALHVSVAPQPLTLPVEATGGIVQAREGDTIRVRPPAAGTVVLLPTVRAANKGAEVTILVEGTAGTVTVRAVDSLVQGQSQVVLTGLGLRVLRSDGGSGQASGSWWIVGQSSADSGNQLVAISAGTNIISSGTAVFSNANGVSFGADTAGIVTASVVTGIGLTIPGFTSQVAGLSFLNANNMSWTGNNSSIIGLPFVQFSANGSSSALSFLQFAPSNGLTFGLSTSNNNRGTVTGSFSTLSFSNANNVSFGIAGSTITATASVASSLTAIRLSAGTTSNLLSQFTLSNANNVTFGLNASVVTASVTVASTQASINISAGTTSSLASAFTFSNSNGLAFGLNGATITGSYTVPSVAGFITAINITGAASSVNATQINLSNANGFSFLLSTGAGNATISGSYTVPSIVGLISAINISAGTTSNNLTAVTFSNSNGVSFGLNGSVVTASIAAGGAAGSISAGTTNVALGQAVFSNSNNVSFGLNGSTVTASVTVASTQGSITVSAGASSVALTNLVFTNSNNVGFAMSTAAGGGTVRAAASINISAGTGTAAVSQLSFADGNGVSWGLTNNSSTVFASVVPQIGLVSHAGGNSVGSVTRLAFSNASNVTFSLSTAANAATVLASVDAAVTGGVNWADTATTHTSGTLLAHSGLNLSTIFSAGIGGNSTRNVQLGFAGTNLTGQAHIRVDDNTTGVGLVATKVAFLASNGITFGAFSTETGVGARQVAITASVSVPVVSFWRNISENDIAATDFGPFASTLRVFPLGNGPFFGNMTINTLDILHAGSAMTSTQGTSTWAVSLRGGLYTLANSTQLSLLNSFSTVHSSGSIASANSGSRNALYAGSKWMTIGTGAWSSSPVLSNGINYWMAVVWSTSGGTAAFQSWIIQRQPGAAVGGFGGIIGVSAAGAASARGFSPFLGYASTGGIPTTIGTADMLTVTSPSLMMFPCIQLRNGVALGN